MKFASVTIAARNPTKTRTELAERDLEHIPVGDDINKTLESSHIIILATPGIHEESAIKAFAESLGNMSHKIIIDATNPLGPFSTGLCVRWEAGTSGAEILQKYLPEAIVFKAFNTVGVEHMQEALGKDMLFAGGASDDVAKTSIVEGVIRAVGFKPFYVGPIRYARNLEAMAELWIHMAVPPLGARNTSRNFWFSISGDP
jgi:predicted dinucleotide-binding enzyme